MASVSAQDFINVMDISDTTTKIEYVLNLAIDCLNIFGAELSNMSGDAGSKSVTLTSKQRGGVFIIGREIYKKFFKDAGTSASLSPMAVSVGDILNDTDLAELCEKIGDKLEAAGEGIAFAVAHDTSGIE